MFNNEHMEKAAFIKYSYLHNASYAQHICIFWMCDKYNSKALHILNNHLKNTEAET